MTCIEKQLTWEPLGHILNSTQSFSPNDEWLVYDGRLQDHLLASNDLIGMVHTTTGEIRPLYQTERSSEFGPGVGAASFSPCGQRVLFIHGIRNADASRPYSFTRRSGVSICVQDPFNPVFMDARDIVAPFTNGALRGGTHAHTWSGDGKWISFTYNDYVIELASVYNPSIRDLRTIGVMANNIPVQVVHEGDHENFSGTCFSILVAPVTERPRWGSDEVEKAFDECWIGEQGYRKTTGEWQNRAIAYQGIVRDEKGKAKTEIFVADLPDDLFARARAMDLKASFAERLPVPDGILYRRISFTDKGLATHPRHWLRSNRQGTHIAFLAADENERIRLCHISPNGGKISYITSGDYDVQGPFNFSPDGNWLTYIADNSVFISHIDGDRCIRLTEPDTSDTRILGAVQWSHNGTMLAYNRMIADKAGNQFAQIFLLHLPIGMF